MDHPVLALATQVKVWTDNALVAEAEDAVVAGVAEDPVVVSADAIHLLSGLLDGLAAHSDSDSVERTPGVFQGVHLL